jgi:hypothetical protein
LTKDQAVGRAASGAPEDAQLLAEEEKLEVATGRGAAAKAVQLMSVIVNVIANVTSVCDGISDFDASRAHPTSSSSAPRARSDCDRACASRGLVGLVDPQSLGRVAKFGG